MAMDLSRRDHVLFFVKFFEVELFAQEFMKGRLYLQPLSAFKKMEEKDDGRGDRHEGTSIYMPRNQIGAMKFGPLTFHAEEILNDLAFQPIDANPINVLCLYAATPGRFADSGINSDSLGEFLAHIKIPEKCLDMGKYAVCVGAPVEFSRRFRAAAERAGFKSKAAN